MIGVFDSGVGGLSVLNSIRTRLPESDLVYVADRERAPYGTRSLDEVASMSHEIVSWLLDYGSECIVIACNTASAAALESVRRSHPGLPVVGMEPAVKPAAEATASGTVAVFATAATFQGVLFDSVVSRFATGVEVLPRACPSWVEAVERGEVSNENVVREEVAWARDNGADRIVLACTHFSFLRPLIESVSGIPVIDPADAVAAQTQRVAPSAEGTGHMTLAASGDTVEFAALAARLAGISSPVIPFPA